jgi:hypothetical protein
VPRLEARTQRRTREHLQKVKAATRDRVAKLQKYRSSVEARIDRYWGEALSDLEALILEAREIGTGASKGTPASTARVVHFVHHSLYGRSLLAASEVLVLLRTGHGFGALTRWRTLLELASFAEFIQQRGEEAAERFRDHYIVDTNKYLTMRWPDTEGNQATIPPATVALKADIAAQTLALKERYGAAFLRDLGWALKWFPGKGRVTIQDIVDQAGAPKAKVMYRQASAYIHSGGRGTLDHHIIKDADTGAPLCEPNDLSISKPGRLAVITLAWHAVSLVGACNAPRMRHRVLALRQFAEETQEKFRDGHRKWVEETGNDDLMWNE